LQGDGLPEESRPLANAPAGTIKTLDGVLSAIHFEQTRAEPEESFGPIRIEAQNTRRRKAWHHRQAARLTRCYRVIGIEDLQIAYACDIQPSTDGDGVFTEGTDSTTKKADEWTYNVGGDVPPAGCNRPQAVRITIVARSTEVDTTLAGLATNRKPATEDGVAGAIDAYRHRVLTTTVYPRNR